MTITIDVEATDGVTHKAYTVIVKLWGWQINATNVGLAGVGVDKTTLPIYPGSDPASFTVIPAGSTITLQKIYNPDVSAGNITFDRCWIINTGYGGLGASDKGPVTLQDCDMESDYYQAGVVDQYAAQPITVFRCNLTGGGCSKMNGPGTIQQSYLHDYISSTGSGGPNHVDGFTRRSGIDQVNILDNYIDSYTNPNHTSATVFLQANSYFDNILFQGNLFSNGANGGGSDALEAKDGNEYGGHLIMDNNRFTPNSGEENTTPQDTVKQHGYVLDYNTNPYSHGLGWGQWTDNYVYNPNQPDCKGGVVPEP